MQKESEIDKLISQANLLTQSGRKKGDRNKKLDGIPGYQQNGDRISNNPYHDTDQEARLTNGSNPSNRMIKNKSMA